MSPFYKRQMEILATIPSFFFVALGLDWQLLDNNKNNNDNNNNNNDNNSASRNNKRSSSRSMKPSTLPHHPRNKQALLPLDFRFPELFSDNNDDEGDDDDEDSTTKNNNSHNGGDRYPGLHTINLYKVTSNIIKRPSRYGGRTPISLPPLIPK